MAWALRALPDPLPSSISGSLLSFIAHRVVLSDGREAWTVLGADGAEVAPVVGFLRYLHRIERSPNTLRAYAHDLKLFWEFLAGRGVAWDAVELADLGDFAAWLRRPAPNVVPLPGGRAARSAATTNRALSAVMGFYDFHARHGVPVAAALVDRGRGGRGSYRPFLYGIARPTARARVGRLREVRELPKVLTLEQISAIIAAQGRLRDRFLFGLLAETGMRVSQALGLRHEDMRTWERRVELVPREDNANGARGKGGRGFALISDELVRLHALYMSEEYGLIDSDYVFINLWAGEIGAPLRYGAVDALVRRTRARVGFDFHPHMFRHTFVTVAQRHRMPLEVISKAVCHACVQTTADIYSHLDAEDLRRELVAAGMLGRLGELA